MAGKIFEIFRSLKSDAVPRPPRPETEDFTENENQENENVEHPNDDTENIDTEMPKKKKEKSAFNNNFFKPNKKKDSFATPKKEAKDHKGVSNSNVNVQATGNVINIVNSRDVHWGNEIVYYMGPTNVQPKEEKEVTIEKNNIIEHLLEATIQPTHEYIDYISKNLGKNWHNIFVSLGFSKNRIETFEIDEGHKGISEVRYKILLDWVRNDDDGTLGKLTTLLWEEGEIQLVKELAIIYKKNKK